MTRNFKPFRLLLHLLLTTVVIVLLSSPIVAQETPAERPEAEKGDTEIFKAPVIVDGDTLFYLRGSSALPAAERAERVQNNIIEVAEASDTPSVDITFEETDLGTRIRADGTIISIVTVADAELDQMELDVLTLLHGDAIEEAILSYRANRTEQARVSGAIEAATWTAGFVAFIVAILWLHRRIRRRTLKFVKRHLKDVETATAESVQAEAIAALVRYGLNFILLMIFFLGFYYYLSFVLLAFAETRYFAQLLLTYLTEPVLLIFKGIISYIPNLIMLALITWVTLYTFKGMRVISSRGCGCFFTRLRPARSIWVILRNTGSTRPSISPASSSS